MSEAQYLTALCAFGYFGPARTKLLLTYFGSAEKIWTAKKEEFVEIGISNLKAQEFVEFRKNFSPEKYFKKLKDLSIKVLTMLDAGYPENLKSVEDAPQVLYVRGELLPQDSNAVAMVGTRLMTTYGREVTNKLATEFAGYGVTVVSGLALGVDAEAQRSALLAGGRTIAVLASGLDIISPYSNKALALEFIKGNGALVSEYPLGHLPFKSDFAVRNRLISGLSKAVVVVEGRMKSGTFYTVHAAAEQGRPVFAVPGPITSPASEGTNYLIQNGAKLITSSRDVIDELSLQISVDPVKINKIMPSGPEEEKLLGLLEVEPLHLDELVRILGLATSVVSARLTIMEMKGLVKTLGNSVYQKI